MTCAVRKLRQRMRKREPVKTGGFKLYGGLLLPLLCRAIRLESAPLNGLFAASLRWLPRGRGIADRPTGCFELHIEKRPPNAFDLGVIPEASTKTQAAPYSARQQRACMGRSEQNKAPTLTSQRQPDSGRVPARTGQCRKRRLAPVRWPWKWNGLGKAVPGRRYQGMACLFLSGL